MKKLVCIVCVLALLLSFGGCSSKEEGLFPTPEDVTISALKGLTTPRGMLTHAGAFEIQWRNDDVPNGGEYASTTIMRYRYDGDNIYINQIADYDSGDHTLLYFTTDRKTPKLFVENTDGVNVQDMSDRDIQDSLDQTLFGYEYYDCEITSAKKSGDMYQIEYDAFLNEEKVQHVTMDVDPITGAVTGAVIDYYSEGEIEGQTKVTVTYDKDVKIDTSPLDQAIELGLYDPNEVVTASPASSSTFNFAAYDLDGNLRTFNDVAGAKLIMVNFWEPWCQPCVSEMPDLELLYEDYQDAGLTILGVFSSEDMDDDARAVIKETGVTYPIVHCDNNLALYQTDSVPTTIFLDGEGNVLTDEPYIGSRSYEDWLAIISDLMETIDANAAAEE